MAIYMQSRVPEMEYVFCDTQKELPETYEYLDRLEGILRKKIVRLNAERGFDHWLAVYRGYLPSSRMRWCTRMLKIKPFEDYVGDELVYSYIGIRADENREGYVSTKENIVPVFPFKEDGIVKADVYKLLEDNGVGLPEYYKWRSRSGCYFCFFQRKAEWIGLKEHHPDLFELAKRYEKTDPETGKTYTWVKEESLVDIEQPGRIKEIKTNHTRAMLHASRDRADRPLVDVLAAALDDDDDEVPCLICEL